MSKWSRFLCPSGWQRSLFSMKAAGRFFLRSTTAGSLGFTSSVYPVLVALALTQFTLHVELATGGYSGHFICVLHTIYTGMYSASSFLTFHTSTTCYRVCNIFLTLHTAELHTIYVHNTSHDQ